MPSWPPPSGRDLVALGMVLIAVAALVAAALLGWTRGDCAPGLISLASAVVGYLGGAWHPPPAGRRRPRRPGP